MTSPVLAAYAWTNNAELIAACARLGYLRRDDLVLDPTYGRGTWWKVWRPDNLVTHDIALDGVDFRSLPEPDSHFDAIAYDPPYVCIGGRTTSGIPEFHKRYGLIDTPRSPAGLQQLINDGMTELRRVLKPRGILLAKCQDYISSGKLWPGTHHTLTHALDLGFVLVDRFEHIGKPRTQPKRARQVHARRNLSTLFVLRRSR